MFKNLTMITEEEVCFGVMSILGQGGRWNPQKINNCKENYLSLKE